MYWWFRRFVRRFLFKTIHDMAVMIDRERVGREATPGEQALDLGKGFDLITGTSTGAIAGCALAVGKPLGEVVALYRQQGKRIFPHRIKGTASALYRAFVLRGSVVRTGDKALAGVLDDIRMIDVHERRGISLSIPTVAMKTHRAWVFKKTPKSGPRDELYPLVDVCMASSAAPIYRSLAAVVDPMARHGLKQFFADGGLWANNPILVGLIDALAVAPAGQSIEVFSLGTCSRPVAGAMPDGGARRWRAAVGAVRDRLRILHGGEPLPLGREALSGYNHQWRIVAGWRIEVDFREATPRRIDILIPLAFPRAWPRIALVDRPAFLAWPHVERDGILCLLSNMTQVDVDDPASVVVDLLD